MLLQIRLDQLRECQPARDPPFPSKPLEFTLESVPRVLLRGEPAPLHAPRVLVHNAIVHNLPDHGTVWVTTSAQPNGAALTVESTGDKLTPALVSTLAEPFQRGTRRARTDHDGVGVGLGLAIVKSITQAHDGTLTLTPRERGGLSVTVQLPIAPPNAGT